MMTQRQIDAMRHKKERQALQAEIERLKPEEDRLNWMAQFFDKAALTECVEEIYRHSFGGSFREAVDNARSGRED